MIAHVVLRAIACLGVGLWLTLAAASPGDAPARSAAEIMDILMWNREPVGGPFTLTDQAGHERSDRDFRGRLMLVYFGFTTCPDVCPTDLQAIGLALDKLGRDADSVQPIFITVDPERDTASHLADYVPLFHPRLIGLTGSSDAIRKVADAYKVYYAKVPLQDADYTVDHTAYIYLMDRDGSYLGFFPPGTSADRMVEIIKPRLAAPGR
ncbi:SCO family protein [Bradyrhizobium sp. Arg68]|uniref:SCO family protein n=1 Tax=Bradyrhizobium ivorense TaxID=2511166 RepID=UPI001E470E64|nr:SCO family protein [Bradyrhizobium ivorense]